MGTMGTLPGPTFLAGGTIAPFKIVKLDTTANQVVQTSGTTDPCFGVSQPAQKGTPGVTGSDTTVAASSGDPVEVIGGGNVAMVTAGGSVTAGDRVNSDASGNAVTVPAGAGNYNVLGWALEGASNTQLFRVYVWPHKDTH